MYGRGHAWQGACMAEGAAYVAGGHAWQGGVWQGACMAGGMCGGGHAWQGCAWKGVCMAGGMYAMHAPPPGNCLAT